MTRIRACVGKYERIHAGQRIVVLRLADGSIRIVWPKKPETQPAA